MSQPIPNRTIPPFVRSVDCSFPHTAVRRPPDAVPVSRWVSYMRASGAPQRKLSREEEEQADRIWAAYDEKREHDEEALLASERKNSAENQRRHAFLRRVQRSLMRSPFAPLFFRIFILLTTVVSLALAADIFRHNRPCKDHSTHTLAIVVNSLSLPYTLYITWDEFFSKPIGLRRARSKLRLMLLDLAFIIFESANISLAFDAGTNTDRELRAPHRKCSEQWGLIVVVLITLTAWIGTFLLSLFRMVYMMDNDR
ncbi:uncharacterized protein PV09_06441 [Verruconis gallopava]|uniref:Regulator of phospholipase D SRF1 n=1 Tax=Verruconis gallopava TaxID=253628 RepID=A0A0D2AT13_9PEZI|nr:uncharacterized protein PV09_06441 [Verruconis gallopava]KIW02294.1 hypothetical protein PV09_06441 [Verruconis gallopava]